MSECIICNRCNSPEDAVLYGEWMVKQNVQVHYYCLLLSTNLPQRGSDSSGILGFQLRDIRQEAVKASKRKCAFCTKTGASVACYKCGIVFHVACGMQNHCVNQFYDEFRSYCETCAPLDDYQRQLVSKPPKNVRCDICIQNILPFVLQSVAYGDCCRKGFAHRICMRRYALAAGYYLRCLWCRDKKFRDTVRLQSVFVPDRDATWERQKNAYSELHTKRLRCDQDVCLCPFGKDYNSKAWVIQLCSFCGGFGTHSKCRIKRASDNESTKFKCDSCAKLEQNMNLQKKNNNQLAKIKPLCLMEDDQIDASIYLAKTCSDMNIVPLDDDSPNQSDANTDTSTDGSVITIVPSQVQQRNSCQLPPMNQPVDSSAPMEVIDLVGSHQLDNSLDPFRIPKPPLMLKKSFISGDHFYLQIYDYNDNLPAECIGTCTLQFARDDPRIQDRSDESLQELKLTKQDIWFRDSSRGIYDKIDQYVKNLT